MKKTGWIILLGFFMLACSYSDLVSLAAITPQALASPTEMILVTPSDTPLITPTLATPTFTSTPTLVNYWLMPTSMPTDQMTGTIDVMALSNSFLTPQAVGFTTIQTTGSMIRWGSCQPDSVRITAHVTDPIREHSVLLFIRLKDTKSSNTTEWGYGADMNSNGKGIFTYTVFAKSISHYKDFLIAWVQYQLVAFDRNLKEVGRTQPYLSSISIGPCP